MQNYSLNIPKYQQKPFKRHTYTHTYIHTYIHTYRQKQTDKTRKANLCYSVLDSVCYSMYIFFIIYFCSKSELSVAATEILNTYLQTVWAHFSFAFCSFGQIYIYLPYFCFVKVLYVDKRLLSKRFLLLLIK